MKSSRPRLIPLVIVLAVAITPAVVRAIGQWRAESVSALPGGRMRFGGLRAASVAAGVA